VLSPRDRHPHALEPLKPVLEHRAVRLAQDIQPHVHYEIRADTEDIPIEGGMVQRAERHAIGDDGLASRVAVRQDVGGLEQLQIPKPADRASLLIRSQHSLPERLLVKPSLRDDGHVRSPRFSNPVIRIRHEQGMLLLVDGDEEAQCRGLVSDHVRGPDGHVLAGDHSKQVDEREPTQQGATKSHVVRVLWIGSSVAIP
jgi:hypothetical protein